MDYIYKIVVLFQIKFDADNIRVFSVQEVLLIQ